MVKDRKKTRIMKRGERQKKDGMGWDGEWETGSDVNEIHA